MRQETLGLNKKGIALIADTKLEVVAFDKLDRSDRELLERCQIILSQSKLHELEQKDPNITVALPHDEKRMNVLRLITEIETVKEIHNKLRNNIASSSKKRCTSARQKA